MAGCDECLTAAPTMLCARCQSPAAACCTLSELQTAWVAATSRPWAWLTAQTKMPFQSPVNRPACRASPGKSRPRSAARRRQCSSVPGSRCAHTASAAFGSVGIEHGCPAVTSAGATSKLQEHLTLKLRCPPCVPPPHVSAVCWRTASGLQEPPSHAVTCCSSCKPAQRPCAHTETCCTGCDLGAGGFFMCRDLLRQLWARSSALRSVAPVVCYCVCANCRLAQASWSASR